MISLCHSSEFSRKGTKNLRNDAHSFAYYYILTLRPHPLRRAIDAGTLIEFEAELR